jgi:hypothetical protein
LSSHKVDTLDPRMLAQRQNENKTHRVTALTHT